MPQVSIFISSVQREFAAERRALKEFIEGDALLRRFFSAFIFEDLPARDQRADEAYLDAVERCAVYVGLFGLEYGSEDAQGISPTQREFEHATRLGRPRLVFVKRTEQGTRHVKMEALVRQAEAQVIRRGFGSLPELTAGLYASLVEHLSRMGALRDKPFDAASCPGATVADLSQERLDWLLERARVERAYPLGPGTSMEAALAHLNLLDGEAWPTTSRRRAAGSWT
jgi:ATP-dependent DNA helicase RecG